MNILLISSLSTVVLLLSSFTLGYFTSLPIQVLVVPVIAILWGENKLEFSLGLHLLVLTMLSLLIYFHANTIVELSLAWKLLLPIGLFLMGMFSFTQVLNYELATATTKGCALLCIVLFTVYAFNDRKTYPHFGKKEYVEMEWDSAKYQKNKNTDYHVFDEKEIYNHNGVVFFSGQIKVPNSRDNSPLSRWWYPEIGYNGWFLFKYENNLVSLVKETLPQSDYDGVLTWNPVMFEHNNKLIRIEEGIFYFFDPRTHELTLITPKDEKFYDYQFVNSQLFLVRSDDSIFKLNDNGELSPTNVAGRAYALENHLYVFNQEESQVLKLDATGKVVHRITHPLPQDKETWGIHQRKDNVIMVMTGSRETKNITIFKFENDSFTTLGDDKIAHEEYNKD